MQLKYRLTSLCDQNCGVQSADRHTDTGTDRKVKTLESKIMQYEKLLSSNCDHIGGATVLLNKNIR